MLNIKWISVQSIYACKIQLNSHAAYYKPNLPFKEFVLTKNERDETEQYNITISDKKVVSIFVLYFMKPWKQYSFMNWLCVVYLCNKTKIVKIKILIEIQRVLMQNGFQTVSSKMLYQHWTSARSAYIVYIVYRNNCTLKTICLAILWIEYFVH